MASPKYTGKVTRGSYKEFLDLFMRDEAAFRTLYTRQRDIAHKQLDRLSKSGGAKANLAKDWTEGRGRIRKLSELDKELKNSGRTREQIARDYAHALSNINTAIFSPRASLKGWRGILSRIKKTLQENNYGDISTAQLEMMGEIMARVYAIYGRKYAPSEEVMEAIGAGYGEEMLRMTDDQLKTMLSNWEAGDHDNIDVY